MNFLIQILIINNNYNTDPKRNKSKIVNQECLTMKDIYNREQS